MKQFVAGIICLLSTLPWSARAQDEAPNGSDAHAAVEGGAPAAPDPLVEQTRRLEERVRALEERPAESQPVPAPALSGRRTFGLGLAGGGGVLAAPASAGVLNWWGADAIVMAQLPSVEARFFLANGVSVDLSVPVGDIIARGLRGAGFAFTSELFWNFNAQVAPGLHLMLGPGLGFSAGVALIPAGPGGPEPASSGDVRLALQAGVEFLAAGGHLGIALSVRPRAGVFMWEEWGATRTAFVGGVVGLVSLSYFVAATPWSARAQEEAPNGSVAAPAVERSPEARPEPPVGQTQGPEDRARAPEEKPSASQPVQAAAPPRRRTFGLGLAAGGGVLGPPSSASDFLLGLRARGGWLAGQLPSVEARFFLENGMSLDLSVLVGDIIGRIASGRSKAITSELFWNFNVQCAPGTHLLLGPGLGLTVGEFPVFGLMALETSIGGEVRLGLQTGVEFLTAGGHLGIALSVRPRVGFYAWFDMNNNLRAAFIGGVMGLMSVNYYFLAR